jgi:hypothetical protein
MLRRYAMRSRGICRISQIETRIGRMDVGTFMTDLRHMRLVSYTLRTTASRAEGTYPSFLSTHMFGKIIGARLVRRSTTCFSTAHQKSVVGLVGYLSRACMIFAAKPLED